jgi:hypothetical protein
MYRFMKGNVFIIKIIVLTKIVYYLEKGFVVNDSTECVKEPVDFINVFQHVSAIGCNLQGGS